FCLTHLKFLLSTEISRVRKDMYNDTLNGSTEKRSAELPDAVGPIVQLQEKLYVPVKEYPDFNFVGRILGPRGLTAKQLEAETGCKIMVRGKGSMRDKKKEEQNRGKPNWEHLNEDLHVLITVEDAQNRAEIKLKRAVEEVKKLLVPAAEGEDSLKKMQLMELAILNGTYRDANIKSPTAQAAPRIITGPAPVLPPAALRTPTPAGPTIMPLIRQIQTAVMPNGTPHPTAAIVPPGPEAGLIYTPYEYPYTLAPATSILEYPIEPSGVLVHPSLSSLPKVLNRQNCLHHFVVSHIMSILLHEDVKSGGEDALRPSSYPELESWAPTKHFPRVASDDMAEAALLLSPSQREPTSLMLLSLTGQPFLCSLWDKAAPSTALCRERGRAASTCCVCVPSKAGLADREQRAGLMGPACLARGGQHKASLGSFASPVKRLQQTRWCLFFLAVVRGSLSPECGPKAGSSAPTQASCCARLEHSRLKTSLWRISAAGALSIEVIQQGPSSLVVLRGTCDMALDQALLKPPAGRAGEARRSDWLQVTGLCGGSV
ncbi:Protein quaking, partial [Tupaia chinensis]